MEHVHEKGGLQM